MPDPVLPGKLGLYLSMMHYGLTHNRDFALEHYEFFNSLIDYVGSIQGKRILDVGCGKSYWLSLLLHSAGANVTGIDTEVTQSGISFGKYKKMLQTNGFERVARTLVWELVFARPYYKELDKLAPFDLRFDGLELKAQNATTIDFDDNTFDFVVSHEVFEHISDIPRTVKELSRVLKPNGMTYIYVHSFTSLSGGHHIAWKYPDTEPSKVVPPWDHLREYKHRYIPSWLNSLRTKDYREAFEHEFDIAEWIPTGREGEQLLTPSLRQELSEYSEDELLTKGFIVVATPKKESNRASSTEYVTERISA